MGQEPVAHNKDNCSLGDMLGLHGNPYNMKILICMCMSDLY